ncbi:MAG: AAC(3) family N-acetyltransferase [Campylobacter sp.]|nr:AAC(3) family N-acetyltransferase [Campylobacter sp.]
MQLTTLLSEEEFKNTLNELGIKKGDNICLHSALYNLGLPVIQHKAYLQKLCEILMQHIGEEGSIAMPSFTYSFCNNEIFNVQKSFSKMGTLNEFFRKNYAKRTLDPNFSYSVWGAKSQYLLDADSTETFGKDGIFARLKNIDAKMLDIGQTFSWTFMHYAEKMANVPYRYDKKFTGQICDNDKIYETYVIYFVRNLDKPSHINAHDQFCEISKTLKRSHIDKCNFLYFDLKELYDFMIEKLQKDKNYFLIRN